MIYWTYCSVQISHLCKSDEERFTITNADDRPRLQRSRESHPVIVNNEQVQSPAIKGSPVVKDIGYTSVSLRACESPPANIRVGDVCRRGSSQLASRAVMPRLVLQST
ncbi:hypothetical protein J6590_027990 [Homalodisca vitripennis]|nr:hypothetical protein J6590_027990 [Homalodisca vitripennis]